jgi:asparagine synthetase B (glutamine-hydrolysing)
VTVSAALEEREVAPDTSSFVVRLEPGRALPKVSSPGEAAPAQVARIGSSLAVFDGHLFDREELAGISSADPGLGDADLVLRAYFELGSGVLERIDGVFALVVWDGRSDSILAARDPLGHHPLFYAKGRDGAWHFSDSIVALARTNAVSSSLNREALAASLINYHMDVAETYFEAIRRVPAGRALTVRPSGTSSVRYWDPTPTDKTVEWVTEEDLPHFPTLMERALGRAQSVGRPSIFLSGGIDSVAVATFASDSARRTGAEAPIALSLVFPDPNFDEERVQRLVAAELGMPQTVIPFEDAQGRDGLVLEALRTTASWPTPLVNIWHPLYTRLAQTGRDQGARTVLTGAGGDEWLSVSPRWAADCMRGLHLLELHHFWLTFRNSYTVRKWPMLRNLLWKYGAQVLVRDALRGAAVRVAPGRLEEARRRNVRTRMDPWLAPDRELAKSVEDRAVAWKQETHRQGAYLSDVVPYFENIVVAMEREEAFERGRRLGLEPFMPFWDPGVVDFLVRTPPRLLHAGHRAKGILRGTLAERFPAGGFGDQKKILIIDFTTTMLTEQIPRAWEEYHGAPRLSESGIVDGIALQSAFRSSLRKLQGRERGDESNVSEFSMLGHKLWSVLNLEAWARQWI